MSAIHTSTVASAHEYTRSSTPWLIDESRDAFVGRLFHYLSGGGMRALGRSVAQEETDRKRNRFLIASGVFAAVWLALLVL